jgi:hypothetical protein
MSKTQTIERTQKAEGIFHKTRNIIAIQEFLKHKSIRTTFPYIQRFEMNERKLNKAEEQ